MNNPYDAVLGPDSEYVCPQCGPTGSVNAERHAAESHTAGPVDVEDQAAAEPAGPVPAVAGTFAIYADGSGGFVLVTDVGGTVERRHIPAAIVKMATGGGVFARKFASMFGGG